VGEAVAAGAPVIQIGAFVNTVINFLIVAFAVFMVIRAYTRAQARFVKREIATEPPAAPAPTPDIQLLTEIRDLLRAQSGRSLTSRDPAAVHGRWPRSLQRGVPWVAMPEDATARHAHRPGAARSLDAAATAHWVDYGHEIRMHRNPLLRVTYLVLGWLCVVSGAIGVVLPGWPTTIWIIVATYFFARSSPRFYNWLMNHRVFGPLVRDWRDGQAA
jgi:hypothetical protein